MNIIALLSKLRNLNVALSVEQNSLKINAPEGTLTPALIAELKEKKQQIIAFLQQNIHWQEKYCPIEPVGKKEWYPLAPAQKRLFIHQQMDLTSAVYNMPQFIPLAMPLDHKQVTETFNQLIQRHESLRTSFQLRDGQPVQIVHDTVAFELEYHDNTNTQDQIAPITRQFSRPFDLAHPPLLRVGLIKIATQSFLLMVDIHHIISDEFSHHILKRDFIALYTHQDLPPLKLHYKDYAQWQNTLLQSPAMKKCEAYWLKEFQGEIPILQLPYDFNRPPIKNFKGSIRKNAFDAPATAALRQIAAQKNMTLFMVMLALYNILLAKLSGQEDIVIGTTNSGRLHTDLEQIIGMFVNILPVRHHPEPTMPLNDFFIQVKEKTLAALENQDYQFDLLVEKLSTQINREAGRDPLIDAAFDFQATDTENQTPTSPANPPPLQISLASQTAKLDLLLFVVEEKDILSFAFEYSTNLFKENTIIRFENYFKQLVASILEDQEQKILDVNILPAEEKKQLLVDFNNNKIDFPRDTAIFQLFEKHALTTPHRIAISFKDQQLTYHQLNQHAHLLAIRLLENGIREDQLVGILMKRSPLLPICILATWKAGAAYVPLDTQNPHRRIEEILVDSGARILLTESQWISPQFPRDYQNQIICLDQQATEPRPSLPHQTLPQKINPHSLAYVIYTSGSTGLPKGVMVEHRGLTNHIHSKINALHINPDTIIVQNASHTFDISLWQFFAALACGGKTVIFQDEIILDPKTFIHRVAAERVTILVVVPSYLDAILEVLALEQDLLHLVLDCLVVTGEAMKIHLVKIWFEKYRDIKILNGYGPTEASDNITHYFMHEPIGMNNVPIGKPLPNLSIYIVDPNMKICPIGVKGEICVAGVGVGRGYLGNEEKTKQVFFDNPFAPTTGERFYKTGDIGRWMTDGNIEFFGRKDSLVKIRGFRIELGEIENALLSHPAVKQVVVINKEKEGKNNFLCAYLVLKENSPFDIQAIKNFLKESLPHYMIPEHVVLLDKIPLSANGKIDKKKLHTLFTPESSSATFIPPATPMQAKLVDIWAKILGMEKEKISIDDNFFDLGGHSLNLIRVVSEIYKEFAIEIPVTQLYYHSTIQDIANAMISKNFSDEKVLLLNHAYPKKIFSFPPQIGYGLNYSHLAALIKDFSFYAFNFIQDEDRLHQYVQLITSLQPNGPYILIGYSAAGPLTFQVAKSLENAGHVVSDIIFFECFFSNDETLIQHELEENHLRVYEMVIDDLLNRLGAHFLKEKVWQRSLLYMNYYLRVNSLEKIHAKVHLLIGQQSQAGNHPSFDNPRCWDDLTHATTQIYRAAGTHLELFVSPFIEQNARLLQKILSENTAGQPLNSG